MAPELGHRCAEPGHDITNYESSEFTKSDLFITPDLEDFFSALTLKFDFLPGNDFLPWLNTS